MHSGYRLIWFQHMHKAAGTSVVQLALANGEQCYPQHGNGNPTDVQGNVLPLWDMNAVQLRRFVDHCETMGVTFLATEWGAPDLQALGADRRVRLITVLRDPLSRFLSDFYFSYYGGFTNCRSPMEYAGSCAQAVHTMFNYYCRVLSRHQENPAPIGRAEVAQATDALSHFHYCTALESEDALRKLARSLGWVDHHLHANRSATTLRQAIGLLVRGKPSVLWRRLSVPKRSPPESFVKYFTEEKKWDYQLYEYVRSWQPSCMPQGSVGRLLLAS